MGFGESRRASCARSVMVRDRRGPGEGGLLISSRFAPPPRVLQPAAKAVRQTSPRNSDDRLTSTLDTSLRLQLPCSAVIMRDADVASLAS